MPSPNSHPRPQTYSPLSPRRSPYIILRTSNGALVSDIVLDTSHVATDTIDYVVTDPTGLTATSTRTIMIQAAVPPTSLPPSVATSTPPAAATSTAQ